MMRTLLTCAAALLFTLTVLSSARAWGPDGHRIVCAIAWDEMEPPTRAKAAGLLDIKTSDQFIELCNWADEDAAAHPQTAPWHGLLLAPGVNTIDLDRDCPEPQSCVLRRLLAEAAALERSGAKEARALSLKYLMHFAADIHQPLQVGLAEDRGGRDIRGAFMGKPTTLHELWSSGLIAADGRPWREIAAEIGANITSLQRTEWRPRSEDEWAAESLAITWAPAMGYRPRPRTFDFGEDYKRWAMPVVRARLAAAGVRLGHKLNWVLRGGA